MKEGENIFVITQKLCHLLHLNVIISDVSKKLVQNAIPLYLLQLLTKQDEDKEVKPACMTS